MADIRPFRGREIKVRDIIAPMHNKRSGLCAPCQTSYVWHAYNCPAVKHANCPKCGERLKPSHLRHLPVYSLDGVSFDDGVKIQMFSPWQGWEAAKVSAPAPSDLKPGEWVEILENEGGAPVGAVVQVLSIENNGIILYVFIEDGENFEYAATPISVRRVTQ